MKAAYVQQPVKARLGLPQGGYCDVFMYSVKKFNVTVNIHEHLTSGTADKYISAPS